MTFVPASELIGNSHRVRTIRIMRSPLLPDGEYAFVDMYCTDPGCDCRKTMIQVMHNGKPVSIIDYGWESPEFYRNWMGDSADDSFAPEMSGASIDMTSPDLVSRDAMLGLFSFLLNDDWISRFKQNYGQVKLAISKKSKKVAKKRK